MRVLGIDHGAARCGCAISDPTGTIVRPLEAVPPDPATVAALATELEADAIVVGLPVSLNGTEGEQAATARAFAAELSDRAGVPVETYDERLTTRMAAATRSAGARADEDSLAAAHLLESYLMSTQRPR